MGAFLYGRRLLRRDIGRSAAVGAANVKDSQVRRHAGDLGSMTATVRAARRRLLYGRVPAVVVMHHSVICSLQIAFRLHSEAQVTLESGVAGRPDDAADREAVPKWNRAVNSVAILGARLALTIAAP